MHEEKQEKYILKLKQENKGYQSGKPRFQFFLLAVSFMYRSVAKWSLGTSVLKPLVIFCWLPVGTFQKVIKGTYVHMCVKMARTT